MFLTPKAVYKTEMEIYIVLEKLKINIKNKIKIMKATV